MLSPEIEARIKKIELLALDVDGVLTDGHMVYAEHGDQLKFFDSQDGLGCALLAKAGINVVIITSKKSRINDRRAKEIKIAKVYQDVKDKLAVLEKCAKKFKLDLDQTAFMGDDLIDLAAMCHAGLAIAPHNAVAEVKAKAHVVTHKTGGRGAVREAAELLLKTQNRWAETIERYTRYK